MQEEEEEDYSEEEDEEDARLCRDLTISNQYNMNKFVLDPAARKRSSEINKDMVLGNLDKVELMQVRVYGNLIASLKQLATIFPDIDENVQIAEAQRDTIQVSSRSKDGFGTIMINKQILEHKKIHQEVTKEKKENLGGFGFFKKNKRGGFFER